MSVVEVKSMALFWQIELKESKSSTEKDEKEETIYRVEITTSEWVLLDYDHFLPPCIVATPNASRVGIIDSVISYASIASCTLRKAVQGQLVSKEIRGVTLIELTFHTSWVNSRTTWCFTTKLPWIVWAACSGSTTSVNAKEKTKINGRLDIHFFIHAYKWWYHHSKVNRHRRRTLTLLFVLALGRKSRTCFRLFERMNPGWWWIWGKGYRRFQRQ